MNNTQMREFLEKELPNYKLVLSTAMPILVTKGYEMSHIKHLISALDKAVEDVRKLRKFVQHTVECNEMMYLDNCVCMCGTNNCLEQTSWAEMKEKK